MNNQTIYNAAHIINSVGKQINSMFEHIEELVGEHSDKDSFKSIKCTNDTGNDDSSEWLATSHICNYGIVEKRNIKNETIQVAFQVVIYDEHEDSAVENWQPTLRVLIEAGGDRPWENDGFTLHTALEDGYDLAGSNNLWLWKDKKCPGCIYLLPLASIANKEFLKANIVDPAFRLAEQLAKGAKLNTLTAPQEASGFTQTEGRLSFKP